MLTQDITTMLCKKEFLRSPDTDRFGIFIHGNRVYLNHYSAEDKNSYASEGIAKKTLRDSVWKYTKVKPHSEEAKQALDDLISKGIIEIKQL